MKRVLIADDLEEQRAFYAAPLARAGFVIEEAADGGQVIDIVAARPPDVIVLDLAMPVLDGLEVCRRLKGDDRTAAIPIIVLTGNTLPGVRATVERVGADAFLARPCSPATLLAAIRRHTADDAAASRSRDDESGWEPGRRTRISKAGLVPGALVDPLPIPRLRRRYTIGDGQPIA